MCPLSAANSILFPVFVKLQNPLIFPLPLMFANSLIILRSTDRKELVFGYLILFQMLVPWGGLDID